MDFSLSSGGKAILNSGTLITFEQNADLLIQIKCDDSFSFSVSFEFVNDVQNKEYRIEKKVDSEANEITFVCFNFNNVLGTGTNVPLELASYMGKKIYLHFWVFSLGDNNLLKKVSYTIYQD